MLSNRTRRERHSKRTVYPPQAFSEIRAIRSDTQERLIRRARKVALRLTYCYRDGSASAIPLRLIAEDLGVSITTAWKLVTPAFDEDHPITDARIASLPARPREYMRAFASTIAMLAERGTLAEWIAKYEPKVTARRVKKASAKKFGDRAASPRRSGGMR